MLSVRFKVGVYLLLAPTGADKRGPEDPFPLVGYAGIQPAIIIIIIITLFKCLMYLALLC